MGLTYRFYLDDGTDSRHKIYICSNLGCKSHFAKYEHLISKDFHGINGSAFLFDKVVNIVLSSESEERIMTTGKHLIRYVSCVGCNTKLGWKYIKAYEAAEKYKEGKFILGRREIELTSTLPYTGDMIAFQ